MRHRNFVMPVSPETIQHACLIAMVRKKSGRFRYWQQRLIMSKPLEERLALFTGASRGIGYHTALSLARLGAHVIAVARTQGGLEDLDDEIKSMGGEATLVPLDLSDMAGIDRLGVRSMSAGGKLDILVANAAMLGTISPIGHVEAKVFDR